MNSQLLTDRIYKLETKDRKPELQYSNFEIHLATSAAEMVAYLSGIGDDCFSPFLDAAFELLRIQMLEGFHSGINRNLLEGKTAIKAPSLCILEGFRLAYGVVFHLMKLRALLFYSSASKDLCIYRQHFLFISMRVETNFVDFDFSAYSAASAIILVKFTTLVSSHQP